MLFTRERVIVVRQSAKLPYYASTDTQIDVDDILPELLRTTNVDDILRFDIHNFAILNSEITKVELKKRWEPAMVGVDLNIMTSRKKYKWNDLNIPKKKDVESKRWVTIRDYENILRPIFGDKLSVRLGMQIQEYPYFP